jgi:chromosomal replication initiator protein
LTAKEIWQAALGQIQLQVTPADYDTWIRDTTVVSQEDGLFVIGAPHAFAREWLENRLRNLVKKTLTGLVGRSADVRFVVRSSAAAHERYILAAPPDPAAVTNRAIAREEPEAAAEMEPEVKANGSCASANCLNQRYTFTTFIVGASNRLAHAAAQAVAAQPAGTYNPLFLYGGVGLGKTHLLQAIGHAAVQNGYEVLYTSSERFTNDFIDAIQRSLGDEFRNKYRYTDVLLVDDIQFVIGKERTQEEFFHTFNALHEAGKQIVLTADRPPKAFSALESRLQSRFEWGLIADIQPPDLETRIAILRAKAAQRRCAVPSDVLDLIARKAQHNIRELEGALTRVVAYTTTLGRPLNLETAAEALADLVKRPEVTPGRIIEAVAGHFDLTRTDLCGPGRQKDVSKPRQIAMYLLREETDASLNRIGQELGGRDHSTIHHGHQTIARAVQEDEETRQAVMQIRELLLRS